MNDDKDLDRWARLRFAVIGELLAVPPKRGELKGALLELSERTWSHPNDGTAIRFGFSTLEHWFNQARKASDPVAALRRQRREDAGQTRCLSPQMIQEVNAQYRKYSGWTIQLHHANLIALASEQSELGVPPPTPRYAATSSRMATTEFANRSARRPAPWRRQSVWRNARYEATR